MSKMHCPVCKKVNIIHGGIQIRCGYCGVWSHHDNWTYTKEEWKRITSKSKVKP